MYVCESFCFFAQSTGLEPATFRVTGGRSNQLNYDCMFLSKHIVLHILYTPTLYILVSVGGIEPPTLGL